MGSIQFLSDVNKADGSVIRWITGVTLLEATAPRPESWIDVCFWKIVLNSRSKYGAQILRSWMKRSPGMWSNPSRVKGILLFCDSWSISLMTISPLLAVGNALLTSNFAYNDPNCSSYKLGCSVTTYPPPQRVQDIWAMILMCMVGMADIVVCYNVPELLVVPIPCCI